MSIYLEHFGLREAPFGITPDTAYFFACADYQEALNTLLIAVRNGEGFIKITGEVGTGKTLLCRRFLVALERTTPDNAASAAGPQFVTAYIPTPFLSPHNLLLALADELDLDLPGDVSQHQLVKELTAALVRFSRLGKRVVLCLDEAQAIPLESLETIRLLTNLETEKTKLLQIVLFGQPELDQKLKQNSIRQLTQRITFHFHLGPLRRSDLDTYLSHRLTVAGFSGPRLFSRGAVQWLYLASRGVPRLVNILANKALMLSYGEGAQQVRARHIRAAQYDTVGAKISWSPWIIIPMIVTVVAFLLLVWARLR